MIKGETVGGPVTCAGNGLLLLMLAVGARVFALLLFFKLSINVFMYSC